MKNKNIHEEIERIKSLFTEERLFGNLISEQSDLFSKEAVKQSRKDSKDVNSKNRKDDKTIVKDGIKYCNTNLNSYHKRYFSLNPDKRGDVTKDIKDGMVETKEGLEGCITNYKDKLKIPTFAGMTKDETLDMLLVMFDTSKPDNERLKYKTVTVKDSILGVKPTTNVTTKEKVTIIDSDGAKWGTIQVVKNKEDVFIIKTDGKIRLEVGGSFLSTLVSGKKVIPAIIKTIKEINPKLTPTSFENIKILNAMGNGGQTIKIKVI